MTSSNGNTFHATGHLRANSPVTGEFPAQKSVTRSFDVFSDLRLNERLSKQYWGWWFETLSHPLWRHSNAGPLLLREMSQTSIEIISRPCLTSSSPFNSSWTSGAIWRHKAGTTLAQVIACCLMAPSHRTNKCWHIINKFSWHSSQVIILSRSFQIFHIFAGNALGPQTTFPIQNTSSSFICLYDLVKTCLTTLIWPWNWNVWNRLCNIYTHDRDWTVH